MPQPAAGSWGDLDRRTRKQRDGVKHARSQASVPPLTAASAYAPPSPPLRALPLVAGPAFAFGQFKHVWVYLLSTMAGGACAGLTYDKLFLEEIQVSLAGSCRTLLVTI